jgi:hypothetical protein
MPLWIAILNSFAGVVTAGFGVAAVIRPERFTPPNRVPSPSRFFPALYAARAVPLGIAVAVGVWIMPAGTPIVLLLGVAVAAQVIDILIGAAYRMWSLIGGAAFAGTCLAVALIALI